MERRGAESYEFRTRHVNKYATFPLPLACRALCADLIPPTTEEAFICAV